MRTACNLASFQFAFSAINEQPSMNRSRVVAGGGRQRPNHGEVITNLCIGWSQDRVQTSFVHEPNGMEPNLRGASMMLLLVFLACGRRTGGK